MRRNRVYKLTILVAVLFGVSIMVSGCSIRDTNEKSNDSSAVTTEKPKNESSAADQSPKYEFVETKTESSGNIMDLYVYVENLNLDKLKALCKEKKQKANSGKFYFLVVFDGKDNAAFPVDPFTAAYGLEDAKLKHIKAIYTHNRLNDYSKLNYYDANAWESVAKSVDIN